MAILDPVTMNIILEVIKERGKIAITSLSKILYVIDVVARRKLNRSLTSLNYEMKLACSPLDQDLYIYIDHLLSENLIECELEFWGENTEVVKYTLKEGVVIGNLLDETKEIVEGALITLRGYGGKALFEIIKEIIEQKQG